MEQSCTVFYMPISHKLAGAGVKYEKGRGQQAVLALKVFLKDACIEKTKSRLAGGGTRTCTRWGGDPACCAVQEKFILHRRNCANIKFHNHRLFD